MLLPLILAQAAIDADAVLAAYRARTRAEVPCETPTVANEVVVCGAREADRYRVPFIVHDAGDPRHQAVFTERTRLLQRTDACREKSLFLVGCGFAGVSVSTRGGVSLIGERPLAP